MFWVYVRLSQNLSGPAHVAVFLTTFVAPVALDVTQGWLSTGFCPPCVHLGTLFVYLALYQVAMVVIASATKQDRSRLTTALEKVSLEASEAINQVKKAHDQQLVGLQDRIGDLRDWSENIDRVLRDELGVTPPPRRVSLRGSACLGGLTAEATLSVTNPPGLKRRLVRWARRQPHNLIRWSRKVLWDWRIE